MRWSVLLAAAALAAPVAVWTGAAFGEPGGPAPGRAAVRAALIARAEEGRWEYLVQHGDTLWAIAGSQLGDPYRWPEIARLSASVIQPGGARLADPGRILPGWTLVLPVGSGTSVRVPGVSGATAVVAAGDRTCALIAGGRVTCWGNAYGRQPSDGTGPVLVSGVSGATALAAGSLHACALIAEGRVTCWGSNFDAQLGDGTTTDSPTPVWVSGVSGATAVVAGDMHSCALVAGGKVTCWGDNYTGQLGDGADDGDGTGEGIGPSEVFGVSGATALAAGPEHTCAVIAGGKVTCWGNSSDGDGESLVPVPAPGVSGATDVAVGYYYSCALVSGGKVTCWWNWPSLDGSDIQGRAGRVTGATDVAVGVNHTCAVNAGGQVTCWGNNRHGKLGDGTTTDSAEPVRVSGVSGATAVVAGSGHSCALLTGGHVTCWGDNREGQLGDTRPTQEPQVLPRAGYIRLTRAEQELLLNDPEKYAGQNVSMYVYVPARADSCPTGFLGQILLGVSQIKPDEEIDSNNWGQIDKSPEVNFVFEGMTENHPDELQCKSPNDLRKLLLEVGVTVQDDPSPTFTVNYMDFVRNLIDET